MAPAEGKSRVVPGRYPPPGIDPNADAIRERRGARGITALDANLLHVPPIAGGFNSLLGAVRQKGNLPGHLREAMILRVAALNHATYEWIHHETVGRNEGLTTGQLYVIRDTETPLPPAETVLGPLLTAAIAFTDHSTRGVQVPMEAIQELKSQIKDWVVKTYPSLSTEDTNAKTDDLYVESAMVVASYNMVSRFLLATDVAGLSDAEVPWPVERKEHFISLPSFPPRPTPTHTIHAVTLISSPSAPWLVFANSLLTDWTMWNYIIPYFIDLPSHSSSSDSAQQRKTYNILLHSQRGHGLSKLPPMSDGNQHERLATIPLLATDIANLLSALSIPAPVHSVIGVSQGGAAALAFAALYGTAKTKSVVACDTGPRTPAGNKEAWADRIRLVYSASGTSDPKPDASAHNEYSKQIGMGKLAKVTVPRWFPAGSILNSGEHGGYRRAKWVEAMIESTDVDGFVQGAKALSDYDLISSTPSGDTEASARSPSLFDSDVPRVLLLAGSLDGGGKVGKGLQDLQSKWNVKREERQAATNGSAITHPVEYLEIPNAGHLPMIDSPEIFCENLGRWLEGI